MSSTVTWVVQAWGKISKEVIINSFDVCRITTDNATKILCLRKEHGGADTEESTGTGNLGDIIDEDDNMSMKVKINLYTDSALSGDCDKLRTVRN